MNDLPLLCTTAQARDEHHIRDVGRRIRSWVRQDRLHPVGAYHPAGPGRAVALYPLHRILALAEDTPT